MQTALLLSPRDCVHVHEQHAHTITVAHCAIGSSLSPPHPRARPAVPSRVPTPPTAVDRTDFDNSVESLLGGGDAEDAALADSMLGSGLDGLGHMMKLPSTDGGGEGDDKRRKL